MGLWTVTKDWAMLGLVVAFRWLLAASRGLSVIILGWEGCLRISLPHLKPIDYLRSF
jgi:NADH:ubiquinone oxidoreductase subunit H